MKGSKNIFLFFTIILVTISFVRSQSVSVILVPGMTYKNRLNKNEKHDYSISLNKGEFLEVTVLQKGVDLVVDTYNPSNKLLNSFDSPNGQNGPENASIAEETDGMYHLILHQTEDPTLISDSAKASWAEINQGDYEITLVNVISAEDYQKKAEAKKIKQLKVITSLKENAHVLKSVKHGTGFEDLKFLKPVLKDVRFVGLGEATHGTKEFFQMKARMLEFLVKEMGFRVFVIEASYAGCNNINDYILYGKGSAHTALASQGFWTWDTEEVIDMIEWMRMYNKSVPDNEKVKLMGVDIQINAGGGGFDTLQNYLKKVDPQRASETDSLFMTFRKMDAMKTNEINLDSCKKEYFSLLSYITMSKGLYVQKSSEQEYENVLQYARAIGQLFDAYFMNLTDIRKKEREWRDYYMASNFHYLVQREKPGTKFVIWAHNAHISHDDSASVNGGNKPFGSYLKDSFGKQYYAFGFSFL